ncbi:hypothetical protein SOASR032_26140 [Pragia fontium]|uniref:Pyosin/cloacin translocation domain-containing protein n=1 Tax=Pragia fontium TaxID=82985 RepID=A0ABQ5LKG4_9GAMM|nr:S-type pyocin domain-containing protein [Pragia fontium]GKX64045.1 hypothetical protein SOASR032_26140 [Pragia fontium]
MGTKRVAVVGDRTTTGGVIITGASTTFGDGRQVACQGDKATCPKCNTVGTIIQGLGTYNIHGKGAALDGYLIACGCSAGTNRIIATMSRMFAEDSRGHTSKASASNIQPQSFAGEQTPLNKNLAEEQSKSKVFAKSCLLEDGCTDAGTKSEPSTNFGTMLLYGAASLMSSDAEANHSSFLNYNPDSDTSNTSYGAVPVPVPIAVPTPFGPMMAMQIMPVATYSSPSVTMPNLLTTMRDNMLVTMLLAVKYSSMGIFVTNPDKDLTQYTQSELGQIAKAQGTVKTRVRFAWKQTDSNHARIYGIHTEAGSPLENVRVRYMDWSQAERRYEFTELGENKPTILWTPANPEGSDIPNTTGYPAPENGEFNQPTILIFPIHELDKASTTEHYPALDEKDFNDYILVFPPDSGMPPIYVMFSNFFRGDDNYKGGPIGLLKEGGISGDHILDHLAEDGDGRLTSFSEKIKSSSGSRGADYFTRKGRIVKISSMDLELLESNGEIEIINKEKAKDIIALDSGLRVANAAYENMKRNNEILVHGQIPAKYIKNAK